MEKVRLGIAGLGRGFVLTLPALRAHPRIEIAGAVDIRPEALDCFAADFGAKAHTSFDSLLADSSIEAIYIATPHELHAPQTIAALESGKHVLVEKPMSMNVGECVRMVRAANQTGKVLIVGPSHGYDEPIRVATDLIELGSYGPARFITALNFTDFMYRPRRTEELDDTRGGGVVYSQAAHHIDVARRIIGMPVASIRAVTGNWDAGRPSDGAYSMLMTFEGGAAASLTYSGYAHFDSDELVEWVSELGWNKAPAAYGGTRKAFASLSRENEIDAKLSRTYGNLVETQASPAPHHEHFGFVLVSCERADLKILPTGIDVYANEERTRIPVAPPTIPRAAVLDDFAGAIAGDRRPVHDGIWGLETMACCTAIIQSSRTGTDVDPRRIVQEQWEILSS